MSGKLNHIRELNGARGRNRTTDTRIFNGGGSIIPLNYSDFTYNNFCVRKSVFVGIWWSRGWKSCAEHSVGNSVRNTKVSAVW